MSILSDWEIKHLVEKENMIEPFVAKEVKEVNAREALGHQSVAAQYAGA